MIPSGLRWEPGSTIRCDPLSKCVLLPYKPPLHGLFVRELRFCDFRHESDLSAQARKCECQFILDRKKLVASLGRPPDVISTTRAGTDSDSAASRKRVL